MASTLGPTQFMGEISLLSGGAWSMPMRAVSDTRVIEVGGGEIRPFPGTYQEFLWTKAGHPPVKPLESKAPEPLPRVEVEANGKAGRVNPIKLRQMKDRCAAIEEEERELADYQGASHAIEAAEALAARRRNLQNLLAEWEDVSQTIESNASLI